METGKVVSWNDDRGFGFISPEEGGRDIFVHRSSVASGALVDGDRVEFEVHPGEKGLLARDVRVI